MCQVCLIVYARAPGSKTVAATNPPSPYDLRWPAVSRLHREACKATVTDGQEPIRGAAMHPVNGTSLLGLHRRQALIARAGSAPGQENNDLRPYALALLAAQDPQAPRLPRRDSVGRFSFNGGVDEEQEPGCRESIEMLTRNPKRRAYP